MNRRALSKFAIYAAAVFCMTVSVVVGEEQENLQIYLLIGQSNMAGRAPFSKEQGEAISHAFLLNDKDEWEAAKNPLNRYSTVRKSLGMQKMNPGYAFAKSMTKGNSAESIGLVVNAKGGSSIKQWAKDTQFYKEAVRRTKIAQKSGKLCGILWHQGESDATDEAYLEKLKQLITNLRSDLGEPEVPFVAGQVRDVKLINDQVAELPTVVPNTGFASSADLTAMDRWHFDTKSMLLLGERYADAMKKLQAKAGSKDPSGKTP